MSEKKKKIITLVVLIAVILLSVFVFGTIASNEDNFGSVYSNLDQKRATVTKLMGGAAAASTAISVLPGDAGTPIAEQLADLSGYFMFILAAICFEKWMVTLTGALAFRILIPIGCLILMWAIWHSDERTRTVGLKTILVALMIFAIVPVSVFVSNKIDASYEASIQQTIEDAEQDSKELQESAGQEKDEGVVSGILNNIAGGVEGQVKKFETLLSNLTESIAVLLVTCCAIPVAVLLFFIWAIKLITGISLDVPEVRLTRFLKKKGLIE